MIDAAQLALLQQWFSPAYPVGGFAYSHGLEAAIAGGEIADAATAEAWIAALLRDGAGRNDAILLACAFRGEDVRDLARALAGSKERETETMAQGAAFAKITSDVFAPVAPGPYPVVIGEAARAAGLPLAPTAAAYLQAFAANLAAACVKFVPLGQTEGQAMLARLTPLCRDLAAMAETAGAGDLGGCALRGDIAALRHETLTTRIFRT